jgi:hypothetical protein
MPTDTAARQRSYRANEHDTLLSEVDGVLCVLFPKAVLAAGFNGEGRAVVAHHRASPPQHPAWHPAFFEQQFMSETLLGVPQQIKAVFAAGEEAMLIPAPLFEPKTAQHWIQKLNASCPTDVLHHGRLAQPEAEYAFTMSAAMDKLLHRYFGDTPVRALPAYQFFKPAKAQYLMQCLVYGGRAVASLHRMGHLMWHQQFECTSAEDLAWQALLLCRELHIPRIDLELELTMASDASFDLATELERYFPKIKWTRNAAADDGAWAPALFLLQQLYACAL